MISFLTRWHQSELNRLAVNVIRRYRIRRYARKIAKLEQEYKTLMRSSPGSTARLAEIVSELGKLWNAKLHDEDSEELVNQNGAKAIWQLQMAVNLVVREGKEKMAKSRSETEIHAAFSEGIRKMIHLMDE